MINLDHFISSDTAVLKIINKATGKPTGWVWTLGDSSHKKAQAWIEAVGQRNLDRAQRIEQAHLNGKKYIPDQRSPDDVRKETAGWFASRIHSVRVGQPRNAPFRVRVRTGFAVRG